MALRVADLVLNNDPRNLPALIAKGDALYALGRNEAAQEVYRSAIAIDPAAAGAQLGFGRTLVKSDPAGAETAFLAALRSDKNSVAALNNLGVARDMLRRGTEAQEAYHLALSIAPDSPDVKINLGRSLALAGRNADAAVVLHQVAADPEAKQQFHNELTAALTLTGDHPAAQQASDIQRPPRGSSDLAQVTNAPPARISQDNPPGAPRASSDLVQVANAPPARTAQEVPPAPLTAPRKPVVASALPPQVADKVEAIVPSLPMTSSSLIQPKQHPEAVGIEGQADLKPYVQLASLLSEPDAMFEWQRLSKRMPNLLGDREPTVTAADVADKHYWRLRTFGFASLQDAKNFCARLIDAGWNCRTGRGL